VCVVQALDLPTELAIPFAFGTSRLRQALDELALLAETLLRAPKRLLEALAFGAMPLRLALRARLDLGDLPTGFFAPLLLLGVMLGRGLAERVELCLGGRAPRGGAGDVVVGLGEGGREGDALAG
jgi:hypothetical protein